MTGRIRMFRHDDKTTSILRSDLGQQALSVLDQADYPLSATEIADRIGREEINSLSRALRRMRDRGILELTNPDQPRDRRYRLTETGEEALSDALQFRQRQAEYDAGEEVDD